MSGHAQCRFKQMLSPKRKPIAQVQKATWHEAPGLVKCACLRDCVAVQSESKERQLARKVEKVFHPTNPVHSPQTINTIII